MNIIKNTLLNAEQGHAESMLIVSAWNFCSVLILDDKTISNYIEHIKVSSDLDVLLMAGELCERGSFGSLGCETAEIFYKNARMLSALHGSYMLARLYSISDYCLVDIKLAEKYYKEAAAAGHEVSRTILWYIYRDGYLGTLKRYIGILITKFVKFRAIFLLIGGEKNAVRFWRYSDLGAGDRVEKMLFRDSNVAYSAIPLKSRPNQIPLRFKLMKKLARVG